MTWFSSTDNLWKNDFLNAQGSSSFERIAKLFSDSSSLSGDSELSVALPKSDASPEVGLRESIRSGAQVDSSRFLLKPLPDGVPHRKRDVLFSLSSGIAGQRATFKNVLDEFLKSFRLVDGLGEASRIKSQNDVPDVILKKMNAGIELKDLSSARNLDGQVKFKLLAMGRHSQYVSIAGGDNSIYRIPRKSGLPKLEKEGYLFFRKGSFSFSVGQSGVVLDETLSKSFSANERGASLVDSLGRSEIFSDLSRGIEPISSYRSPGVKELNNRLVYKGVFPSVNSKGDVVAHHVFDDKSQGKSFSVSGKKFDRDLRRSTLKVGKESPYTIVSSSKGAELHKLGSFESRLSASLDKREFGLGRSASIIPKESDKILSVDKPASLINAKDGIDISSVVPGLKVLLASRATTVLETRKREQAANRVDHAIDIESSGRSATRRR